MLPYQNLGTVGNWILLNVLRKKDDKFLGYFNDGFIGHTGTISIRFQRKFRENKFIGMEICIKILNGSFLLKLPCSVLTFFPTKDKLSDYIVMNITSLICSY